MNLQRWLTGVASALALFAAGCGGGGGIGGTGSPMGTMNFKLTDAPSCGYDHVYVTVEAVRVHQSSTAADDDSGWQELAIDPSVGNRIDLLTLTNGALKTLGLKDLPAGKYTQLRLVLAENDNQGQLENALVLEGGTDEIELKTPSAQQSGLKMNVNLDVPANKVLDVIIDFDACKSVVKAGNSGNYNLKPVLTVTPVLSDAGLRVVGWIAPSVAASAPVVSVQASGVPVKSTVPDPVSGEFVLYPVPVGTYDLVVATGGHATAVMTGVPVVDTAYTYANSASAPIAPALAGSAPGTVSGVVTSTAGAVVRALQVLSGGPTVEVAATPVAAGASSPFALTLPTVAPQRVAFVTPAPNAIVLTDDAAAAGKYTIEASDGTSTQTADIDFGLGVSPLSFVFP